MNKPLTFLLSLTFLFLFSSGVSGETKKFNIATGTGFFLGSSNYVVTNYHVIHGAKQIQVKLVNGEILVAEVALKNPDKDIAILRINGTPSVKRMNVKLSSFSEIRTGDKVFTYGFPMTDFLGDISSSTDSFSTFFSESTLYWAPSSSLSALSLKACFSSKASTLLSSGVYDYFLSECMF